MFNHATFISPKFYPYYLTVIMLLSIVYDGENHKGSFISQQVGRFKGDISLNHWFYYSITL